MTPTTTARLSPTALAALDEQARKSGQCWHPTQNPDGWATSPTEVAVRTKATMNELVRAGLLKRRLPEFSATYQYALTELGRKLATQGKETP